MDLHTPFLSLTGETGGGLGPAPAGRRPLPPPDWVLADRGDGAIAAAPVMSDLGGAPAPADPKPLDPESLDTEPLETAGRLRDDRAALGAYRWAYADEESSPGCESDEAGRGDRESGRLSGAGAFGAKAAGGERRAGLTAFDPGKRGVKALAAVAAVVVVIAAVLAWRARPHVDAVAPPAFGTAGSSAGPEGGGGGVPNAAPAATPRSGTSSAAEVVIAVGGKVRKPGLVRLPPGARVADALAAAGGAEPGVDVAMLNLARKVVDGELILVGVTPSPGVVLGTGPAAPAAGGTPAGAPVNLNTATLTDLDGLPGVGPVLAQRILDARDAQGGFQAVSDLRKVNGIGDARYEQLKDLVTV
jgi:competence protein ComEA